MSNPDPSDPTETIVRALSDAVPDALTRGAITDAGTWSLAGIGARTFRETVPVVAFARDDTSLCFIVTPTDPAQPAYKRTRLYDIVYFSEDVGDDEQDVIYGRDRGLIDGFARWLTEWDGPAGATE